MAKKKKTRFDILIETAAELNKVLGLDPAIDTEDTTEEELESLVREASGLLTEEDELSPQTEKITSAFIADIEAGEAEEEIYVEDLRGEIEALEKRKDLRSFAKDHADIFQEVIDRLDELKSAKALRGALLSHLDDLEELAEEEELDSEEPEETPEPEEPTEEKPKKKRGVIATIAGTIEEAGEEGVTKEEILEVLVEKFPNREADSMSNTINVQVPTRISKERFEVERTDEGRYRKV